MNSDEYMEKLNKVKLDPSRHNLKPVDPKLTFEQYLDQCIKEGEELLSAEEKAKSSIKPIPAQSKKILNDALGKMSSNPYVRVRKQILSKMDAKKRSAIEKMENGTLDKDSRWDMFCKEIRILGDRLSENN